MALREFLLENLADDLEYHPKRAVLYLCLGMASVCFWIFTTSELRFTTVRLAFGIGGVALLLKGVFLLRKSSEGLGFSQLELARLSHPTNRKALPPIPALIAQILQDFGTGVFLLGPVLHIARDINESWNDLPTHQLLLTGLILLLIGWLIRRLSSAKPVIG